MSVRPRTCYLMETERPAIAGAAPTAVEFLARCSASRWPPTWNWPRTSAAAAELRALCEQNLARFKVPARWSFVAAMPRTPLGKIQKFQL